MSDRIFWIERIPGYHYHDTPEGEDCLKKLVFMNKVGLFFGFVAGTIDVISYSKPVGLAAIAARYSAITFPIMAVGSTWTTVTCLSTSFRGKDDTYNYFWGGFASGCVAGAIYRSGTFGTFAAITFGTLGYLKKHMEEHLQLLNHDRKPLIFGGIRGIHYDFSLTPNRPAGWQKE